MEKYLDFFKEILTNYYYNNINAVNGVFKIHKDEADFENAFMDYFREKESAFKMAWNNENANFSTIDKQCELLKHLNFNHQFEIIKNHSFESNVQHMRLLMNCLAIKGDSKTLSIVKDNAVDNIMNTQFFAQCVAYHFDREEFTIIDELNSLFKANVLDYYSHHGCFYGKYIVGGEEVIFPSKFTLSEDIYAPHYNIIFNYSDAKASYLESHSIALPSIEVAYKSIAAIENAFKEEKTYDSHTEKIFNEALNYYTKVKTYKDMQQSLPFKSYKIAKNKI